MRSRLVRFVLLVLVCSAIVIAVAAADTTPDTSKFWPPATDVAIFKDGCAYVVREGNAETSGDTVLTERVPRPVLGTLDVYSLTDGVEVGEVTAYYEEVDEPQEIVDVEAFYREQIDRGVTLESDSGTIEGVLRGVLKPGHLLVETDNGPVLVSSSSVTRLAVAEPVSLETQVRGRRPRFRIRLTSGGRNQVRLGLSYLEESWSWHPSYRVNLLPKNQAELVLSATVVNEAEEVRGAVLHLIVGVPNFMMRGVLSPMALDVDSGTTVRRSPLPAQVFANVAYESVQDQRMSGLAEAPSPVTPAGSVEDLFVYEKKGFSLGKGERMRIELLRRVVAYQDVYKWTVPLPDANRLYNQRALQKQDMIQSEQSGQVWHFLRLTNNTGFPWTTAPAMVVAGWQPVSQDLLRYTPAGEVQDLQVTVASDIKGENKEEEVSRKVVRIFDEGDDYLQITVRGTIELSNAKHTPARVEVTKDFWGEAADTSGGQAARMAEYLWNVNPHTSLKWQVDLPAGGKKTWTYTYNLYVNI